MKTLREVANQSARTAVVRSNKRQLKLQVVTKTVATVMSLIFGVTALIVELPVIYGYSVIGLGLLFAADLLIVIVRNWIALSNRSKLRKRNEDEQPLEVKADPRTEGRLATFARAEQSVTKS
jgi:heme A synthase